MGQGSEDLVELLIAPGLVAAGTLAAPEEAHLEFGAEHLQELWPGLEPCKAEHKGQGTTLQLGRLGVLPKAHTSLRALSLRALPPSSTRNPTRFVNEHDHVCNI